MAGEYYKHIFLRGPSSIRDFKHPKGGGGTGPRIPPRDRTQHAASLNAQLLDSWQSHDEHQRAIAEFERDGAYFEFVSEQGFDLLFQSLDVVKSGIRLLNVRKEGEGLEERTHATVYIPNNKRGYFLNKIRKYETEIYKKSNKPKNYRLIESISLIRLAILESFWSEEEKTLIPSEETEWVEVWISSDTDEIISKFEALLAKLEIESSSCLLKFPERSVKIIYANRRQLEYLVEYSDHIAEFRAARKLATYYVERENMEQTEIAKNLLDRCRFDSASEVSVCILDTGVNNGHILLQPVLSDQDMHVIKPEWGKHDHDGHGTLIAGTSVYGDILSLLNDKSAIRIFHRIESSKILPPSSENLKELWGYFTIQGISLAELEAPDRKRIICLPVSATDDRDRGRPSSWSGAIDEIASGYEDNKKRLIIVSAGNADDSDYRNYPVANLTDEIHDPGQSWNALTIGAFTEKTRIEDPSLKDYSPIAQAGGLSPFSTTSRTWPSRKWPIKPEVLFEGGNVAKGPNDSVFPTEDLKLLSTSYEPTVCQFSPFFATSAAAAQAAWFAAQIQYLYPDAWPETIRALMVHSAEWTDQMKRDFLQGEKKSAYSHLLKICGYGVPNLERALYCLSNELTLISQAELQPYEKVNSKIKTHEMHLYRLPWPIEELSALEEMTVKMRITLSYFIEPSPSQIGWKDRYRYPSHALRFDINAPRETESEFTRRINALARDDNETGGSSDSEDYWKIGKEGRNVGSIHSDIWEGRAADLAGSHIVAVYPTGGWWKERKHLGRWNRKCRYSLVISILTPEQEIDIYTTVAIKVGITIPIEIPIA
jgi:hypothetical protein